MRASSLVLAATVCVFVAGCGGRSTAPPPTTTTAPPPPPTTAPTTTDTRPQEQQVAVYFLRDGEIGAARRAVPRTPAVATAALRELFRGPNDVERESALTSAVPKGASFSEIGIEDGVASVTLSQSLPRAAVAQVVYTLTQFPTVRAVEMGGKRLTRASFEDLTPPIFIESPTPGATVRSPLRIHGTANTFEATFLVKLLLNAAGQRAFQKVVTATSGSGTRGTFDVTIPFEVNVTGTGTLVAWESSAEDGSAIHVVEIPVRIEP